MKIKYLVVIIMFMTLINISVWFAKNNRVQEPNFQITNPPVEETPEEIRPVISTRTPIRDLSLEEVNSMLKTWHEEAPEITEVGFIGKTYQGRDIPYIRLGKKTGPKVLLFAGIHGDEKLAVSTMLGVVGKMLKGYMSDERITELLRTRDIYFIPVLSPESYIKNSRNLLGLDPNRNFNGPRLEHKDSIPCIQALKNFHQKHEFKAVMSCHNFGDVYFYPWGFTHEGTEIEVEYNSLLEEMSALSGNSRDQLFRNEFASLLWI